MPDPAAKNRLTARVGAALELARGGRVAEAEAALQSIADDPEAAALGATTALGLPRKLHSAWVRLAKIEGDLVRLTGFRATAVPPETLLADLFAADAQARATHAAAAAHPVPRVIHQIWIGGPPPAACAAWSGYARRHGWAYRLWDEAALARAWVTADPLWTMMRKAGDLPGAVDIARYHLLAREGGLYLDCDWYPAAAAMPPEAVLPAQGLSVIAEPAPRLVAGGSLLLSNALIAAPAGHPALLHLIAALPAVAERLPKSPAWWVTGPLAFTLSVRRGPVSVLNAGLVAGVVPQGVAWQPEVEALAAKNSAEGGGGFLIAWKGW
ncbi:MAG: mannosyltransferase [Proteobacteria bacterium]|nr:mannosyltransferase [Pseudomonadota bacterium]